MQFPLLRLVTPASANDSVNAFTDELKNLGWVWQGGNKNLDFNPAGTTAQQAVTDVTCPPLIGPIIAGKFQFSGMYDEGRWTRKQHEEVEVFGEPDRLHFAAR
jgi:hypothetical protein